MQQSANTGNKIIVIADDLTGANDTGVQFAKQGLKTTVLLSSDSKLHELEEDVVVLDTQSRSLSPDAAYRKVMRTAVSIQGSGFNVIFKKIDSTLRGNIGQEIDAVMDACDLKLAIVAPAFPKNGRTTVGGYHLLQGVPLEATEIARDPKCPTDESHLPTLLSNQTSRKVGHIGIKIILAGPERILATIKKMLADDVRIIVFDVWQEEHLQDIVTAAMRLDQRVLWAGSAGLAEYLPAAIGIISNSVSDDPVVVLAGSISAVTRAQVIRLRQRADVTYIEVDPCYLVQRETLHEEIGRSFAVAMTAISAGNDVVIASGYGDDIVEKTNSMGASLGLSGRQTAEAVAAALGELCRQVAVSANLSGMVLTGGDIALSTCSLLFATGISVVEEVAPGIPVGLLKGGPCDGLLVVTKAGAFGAEDALCKAVDSLKRYKKEIGCEARYSK